MSADDILLDSEERMEKAVDVFKHALAGIRTGRANPGWSIRCGWKPMARSRR